MKAITTTLYVCGGLMIAAATLGAIDYTSARHKGALDKLYKEEKPAAVPAVADKEIAVEDYSRKAVDRPAEAIETVMPEKAIVKKTTVKPVIKKERKISFKEFSRAPLIEKVPMVDTTAKMK